MSRKKSVIREESFVYFVLDLVNLADIVEN
jgi:hypothetical protein